MRKPLPPHLPREMVTHEPACACPGCGSTTFSRIGQDEREVLEYVPSSFKVIRHVRPKLSCRACETIVQQPMPTLPIERGLPGPGLVAHVLVSKFCDHTPLHRQSGIYAREGVELDRATLADWVGSAVFLLASLGRGDRPPCPRRRHAACRRHAGPGVVARPGQDQDRAAVGAGARRAPLGFGRARGRVLPLLGRPQGRPCRGAARGCRGFLHADGYAGFGKLYQPATPTSDPDLVEVACWSHARRKFYDVHQATASPIALDVLQQIAALFAIESGIRGQPPDCRAAARQDHARPLLDQLRTCLEASLARISGKSALAQAIRYTVSRWTALTRYVADGRLEMSNNAAERGIRPLALGRKNYLFCGSDAGGQRAACIYTIIETAKTERHQPGSLPGRRPRTHRRPSQPRHRRPAALAMGTTASGSSDHHRGQPLTLTDETGIAVCEMNGTKATDEAVRAGARATPSRRMARRQPNTCCGRTCHLRAMAETQAPGAKLSPRSASSPHPTSAAVDRVPSVARSADSCPSCHH